MELLDATVLTAIFGEHFGGEVIKFGLAFTFAAWVHSGRVKKEIAAQAQAISASFNNLAEALRNDLKSLNDRVTRLEHKGD